MSFAMNIEGETQVCLGVSKSCHENVDPLELAKIPAEVAQNPSKSHGLSWFSLHLVGGFNMF